MTVSKKHNSDRELIGQDLANIIVPFLGGILATGAIVRTGFCAEAGEVKTEVYRMVPNV